VWLARGDPERALPFLDKAASLKDEAGVRVDRARALAGLGRTLEAVESLGDGATLDAASQFLRANWLHALGRTQEALAACEAALRADPAVRDVAYHRKGTFLLAAGRPKEAAACFDAALGVNPDDPEYWCDAAVAWRSCGQEAKARRLLDRALDLDPRLERALRLRDLTPVSE
jgi:tetratricopeptide (TPR) repeat protein